MQSNSKKPTQAVILAGGRGERLSPLTDKIPKPMVPFHGKPFLQYLIEYLRAEGFERVLLLLGYLPEKVVEYFGDGEKFGLHIEYSITDVTNETGLRLAAVRDRVDPVFFLMYCDNYCPLDTSSMWEQFCQCNVPAQITAYANTDKFTRSNLNVEGPMVMHYDKSRSAPNLNGVDIGFVFIKAEVLELLNDENLNFEKVVYPELVAKRQLAGYVTHHRYYSVGNLERLPGTEKFLKREPVVILDRDGVLNLKAPRGEYVTRPDDFQWLPGAKEGVSLLKKKGYKIVLVSNQAGIARGKMTEDDLQNIHQKMQNELAEDGGLIDAIYVCPHGWDDNCFCRKPKPGMLFQAQRDLAFDLSRVYFIGDDERDVEAGRAAGCKTYLFKEGDSLLRVSEELKL
jgi:histidinol-phosphate phosphatase family protein